MGFVGQNGSGKTTTIRSILNMANIDSGKISVFGLDSIKDSVEIKERLGVVFDQLYFAEHLNVRQIESQISPFYREWNSEQFSKYLKEFFSKVMSNCLLLILNNILPTSLSLS